MIVGQMLGTRIRRNTCHSEAPSMRAASTISSGIDLIAAESTTIANPVWIHTMITIRKRLFQGCRPSQDDRFLTEPLHDAIQEPDVRAEPLRRKL